VDLKQFSCCLHERIVVSEVEGGAWAVGVCGSHCEEKISGNYIAAERWKCGDIEATAEGQEEGH
jgi:hypothetical protein